MTDSTNSKLHTVIADRLDQIILVGLFIYFCFRISPHGFPPENSYITLLLVSESIVIFFTLIRRSADKISINPKDWIIAVSGSSAALLVEGDSKTYLPEVGGILMLIGLTIHTSAKLYLRRSFGIVPADRGIKSTGLYSVVRHPMYFGYMITHLGFLISIPSVWNLAVYSIGWLLLGYRMILEERLLIQNPEYQDYTTKVRYRLIPRLF